MVCLGTSQKCTPRFGKGRVAYFLRKQEATLVVEAEVLSVVEIVVVVVVSILVAVVVTSLLYIHKTRSKGKKCGRKMDGKACNCRQRDTGKAAKGQRRRLRDISDQIVMEGENKVVK